MRGLACQRDIPVALVFPFDMARCSQFRDLLEVRNRDAQGKVRATRSNGCCSAPLPRCNSNGIMVLSFSFGEFVCFKRKAHKLEGTT